MVLEALKTSQKGCTADELAEKLPTVPMNTLTPRFASLMRKGLIRDTGERRRGKSGRSQRVLCVE
jgi:DNA-binding IclR family transcriptional regulator